MSKKLTVTNSQLMQSLFGINDEFLIYIENHFHVITKVEQDQLLIEGEQAQQAYEVFYNLYSVLQREITITQQDVIAAIKMTDEGNGKQFIALYDEELLRNFKGHKVRCKTLGQRHYIHAIKTNDMVFGIGPAGTGKTYLAVVMAAVALKRGDVRRIILTRPAVEAGESLGFLPGDLKEKVDPYLRPLYDALHDIFGLEQTSRFLERGTIEVAPLAYMRGRTLDDAFVILDEAQNTTTAQMKMFLTRLGFGSKMIITGDMTQIDLPKGVQSGLIEAQARLKNISGISICQLTDTDVVRHPLVGKIIRAYDQKEKNL